MCGPRWHSAPAAGAPTTRPHFPSDTKKLPRWREHTPRPELHQETTPLWPLRYFFSENTSVESCLENIPQCGGWRRCLRTQRAQKARQKEGEGLRLPSWGICVTLSVLPIPSGLAPPLKGDKSMELTGQL